MCNNSKKFLTILLLQILILVASMIFNSNVVKATEDVTTKHYINTEQDLWDFANEVNEGNNFRGIKIYLNKDITLSCNQDKQWIPIGSCNTNDGNLAKDDTNKKVFAGIFEGNGYTIKGVYIDSTENYVGLFGYNEGIIQNLKLKDSYIKSNKRYVGGITAYNNGTIINCHNYANIINNEPSSKGASGGISAYSINANIIDCSNKGKIEGTNGFIAGITGYAKETKIENCYNVGEIKSEAYGASGICGLSYNSWLYNCYNKSEITAINYVGGIVSQILEYSSILNCYNTGKLQNVIKNENLSYETYVGGIVGYSELQIQEDSKVENCYNTGNIIVNNTLNKLTAYQGNISAKHDLGIIDNCYYEEGSTSAIGENNNQEKTTNLVELEENQIKSRETINKLNKGQQAYYYDDQVINNGLPILENQYRVLLIPEDNEGKVIIKDSIRYLKNINPPISVLKGFNKLETEANIKLNDQEIELTNLNDKMKTGIKITTYLNDEQVDYVLVITGDLTGNGEMGDGDLLKLARYKVGLDNSLEGAFVIASDVNKNDTYLEDGDLLKMARILVELDNF